MQVVEVNGEDCIIEEKPPINRCAWGELTRDGEIACKIPEYHCDPALACCGFDNEIGPHQESCHLFIKRGLQEF